MIFLQYFKMETRSNNKDIVNKNVSKIKYLPKIFRSSELNKQNNKAVGERTREHLWTVGGSRPSKEFT